MGNRRHKIVASVATMAVALSACGGSDSSDDSGDADSTDATTAAADATTVADGGAATTAATADGTGCEAVDLSTPPDEAVTIRLGHGAGTEEPLYLMEAAPEQAGVQYEGTFYNLELTEFSPPDRLAAYQAGELDGGTISTPQLFSAVGNGLNVMAAASVAVVRSDGGFTFPYAALEGSDYASGEDLKGATIGIIAPNTATEYWAKSAVAAAGLDPERDVSYVAVPPPTAEQTLRDGQVDIQFFPSDFWAITESNGGVVEVFDALTGPGIDHELLDMFFDRDFVAENPAAYCAWRADYVAAYDAYTADRDSFGQALIDTGFDASPDVEAYSAVTDAGRADGALINLENVQLLIDDMKSIGFLPEDMPVTADELVMPGYSLTD